MEQMMERLLAKVREFHKMMAEIRTNQLSLREKMDSIQEIIAKIDDHQERMEANMNTW
jgi:prefoldin subunit 5